MSDLPKRKDYKSDADFLEAMANHYQIPVYMLKQPSAEAIALCENVWAEVRNRYAKSGVSSDEIPPNTPPTAL